MDKKTSMCFKQEQECGNCYKPAKKPITVEIPLTYLESKDMRYHVMVKRFLVAIISCAVLMLAEAGLFVWLWNQYDYEESSAEISAEFDNEGEMSLADPERLKNKKCSEKSGHFYFARI